VGWACGRAVYINVERTEWLNIGTIWQQGLLQTNIMKIFSKIIIKRKRIK
jgi:hypothetical protein